jgi:hypothetical protein
MNKLFEDIEVELEIEKRIEEIKEIIEIKAEPVQFWKGKLNGLEVALNLIQENKGK